MRPRVSDKNLEALLRRGDPVAREQPVSEAERAALLARLSEQALALPEVPHRRPVGVIFVGGVGLSVAIGLGIWSLLPKPKPLLVAQVPPATISAPPVEIPAPPVSLPAPPSSKPSPPVSIPTPAVVIPAPPSRIPRPSPSLPAPPSSVPTPPVSIPAPPVGVPEPVVTHVLISADSTCAPEKSAPPTEHITIHGDATSVVAVTESLSSPPKEETKEVSL